jgi:hypothetical protein
MSVRGRAIQARWRLQIDRPGRRFGAPSESGDSPTRRVPEDRPSSWHCRSGIMMAPRHSVSARTQSRMQGRATALAEHPGPGSAPRVPSGGGIARKRTPPSRWHRQWQLARRRSLARLSELSTAGRGAASAGPRLVPAAGPLMARARRRRPGAGVSSVPPHGPFELETPAT